MMFDLSEMFGLNQENKYKDASQRVMFATARHSASASFSHTARYFDCPRSRRFSQPHLLGGFVAVLSYLALAASAWAEVTVCNDTSETRTIAIGYEASDGTWTSEGWWTVAVGDCQKVMDGILGREDLYYRAETPNGEFSGTFAFCTDRSAFTILGDTQCEARGHQRTRFRKVDTARVDLFRFSLIGDGEAVALGVDDEGEGEVTPLVATGSLQRGQLGEPFSQRGIFSGCHTIDGLDYCGFEVEGWRYFAIYGDGTAASLLDEMQNWPYPMAVGLAGDIINYGDITVEVALSEVVEVIGGDPFAGERQALQGEWRSLDDPASSMRIVGSDVYEYYDGNWTGHQWMQLAPSCPDAVGLGLGFVRTELETQDSWCVIFDRFSADRIEFVNPGRGNVVGYQRMN